MRRRETASSYLGDPTIARSMGKKLGKLSNQACDRQKQKRREVDTSFGETRLFDIKKKFGKIFEKLRKMRADVLIERVNQPY